MALPVAFYNGVKWRPHHQKVKSRSRTG
uniref:Uncharacterized protein n=1 Tax=Anguilla anguilla TaxID=7936 RepID=A0A0E9SLT7_ANGAN